MTRKNFLDWFFKPYVFSGLLLYHNFWNIHNLTHKTTLALTNRTYTWIGKICELIPCQNTSNIISSCNGFSRLSIVPMICACGVLASMGYCCRLFFLIFEIMQGTVVLFNKFDGIAASCIIKWTKAIWMNTYTLYDFILFPYMLVSFSYQLVSSHQYLLFARFCVYVSHFFYQTLKLFLSCTLEFFNFLILWW